MSFFNVHYLSEIISTPWCAIYEALDTTTAHNLKNKISHQAGRGQWVLNEEHQQQFTVQKADFQKQLEYQFSPLPQNKCTVHFSIIKKSLFSYLACLMFLAEHWLTSRLSVKFYHLTNFRNFVLKTHFIQYKQTKYHET